MGALLTFFSGPAQLKALIIGAIAALIACLALTTWALLERSGRLSCEVDRVALKAQVSVLSDALNRQSASIERTAKAGEDATAAASALLKAAQGLTAQNRGFLDRAEQAIRDAAPRNPDGTAKGCGEARAEMRAERGKR